LNAAGLVPRLRKDGAVQVAAGGHRAHRDCHGAVAAGSGASFGRMGGACTFTGC
jgi:hypothetical protein